MRDATPDDPAVVTRATYDVIAAAYDARTSAPPAGAGGAPAGHFEEWRDNWISLVHARAPVGLAPAGEEGAGPGALPDAAAGEGAAATEPGPRVLDAGAGPGRDTAAFRDAGLDAVALDLSTAMARLARGKRVPVVVADQRRLPFGDGAFDAVWSSAALLHVPRGDVPATLREWRRVTMPGGLLGLTTATGGEDGWEDVPYETDVVPTPQRWFVYHHEPALSGLLADAGWDVESVETYVGPQRTWLQVRATARG